MAATESSRGIVSPASSPARGSAQLVSLAPAIAAKSTPRFAPGEAVSVPEGMEWEQAGHRLTFAPAAMSGSESPWWTTGLALDPGAAPVLVEPRALLYRAGALAEGEPTMVRAEAPGRITRWLAGLRPAKESYSASGTLAFTPRAWRPWLVAVTGGPVRFDPHLFLAAGGDGRPGALRLGIAWPRGIWPALKGENVMLDSEMTGRGWLLLAPPADVSELVRVPLQGESLVVEDAIVILRLGDITARVAPMPSRRTLHQAPATPFARRIYSGQGEVWLVPALAARRARLVEVAATMSPRRAPGFWMPGMKRPST